VIAEEQLPERFRKIIDEEVENFDKPKTIIDARKIPATTDIPLDDPNTWIRIPDVICVYVDMKDSTKLSAGNTDSVLAGAYQLFTGTVVRLFDEFDAPYIDVRGDGAFALFDRDQTHRALAAAVTAKTFVHEEFIPALANRCDEKVGSHVGIDRRQLLVKRIGFRRHAGRTDRQNEVWAGRTVNMAAKLASRSADNEILVSGRYHKTITSEKALRSCGCPIGEKVDLWTKVDVSEDERFDFKTAYSLKSNWCPTHGREFCESLLRADS
jgi:class 3 adenylate cyclase